MTERLGQTMARLGGTNDSIRGPGVACVMVMTVRAETVRFGRPEQGG
jgi:hypothetical protein